MVRRVVNPAAGGDAGAAGAAAGGDAGGGPANLAPVRDGGTPLNLRQGADAIGGLNLFGDEDDGQAGAGGDDNQRGNRTPPQGGNDDDVNDDNNAAGNQGADDDQNDDGNDDQTGGDDDGAQSGDQDGDDKGGQQDADDGASEKPIESLAQLAEALEVDVEFLTNLQDTFKADGEDTTVSLAELRRGYQRDANYRRQTQELAETRRALEAEHGNAVQQVQRELVQVGQVLQQGEATLVGELNTAEMQALRQSNPAEWAARREEIGQRINGVRQLYANAAQQYDAYQQQQAQQLQVQAAELRRAEMDNLRIALPEWGDELRDQLTGYLDTSYGYTANDLKQVFDSRLIVLANKARLYDELQAVGKKTKQKVVNLPNVQRAGKGGNKGPSKDAVNVRKARQRLAKSGKLRDAADLIGLTIKDA